MVKSGAVIVDRTDGGGSAGWQRVRWGAVFAGFVIAIVAQMLLTVLGVAVGLTAIDPLRGVPGEGFGWGAGIWAVASLLVSLFVGAWLAGRLSGVTGTGEGALNGVLVWALSLIAMVYLVGSGIGSLASGIFNVAGGIAQTAGQVVGQGGAAAGPGGGVTSQAREAARGAGIDVGRVEREAQRTAQQAREAVEGIGQSGTPANQQARETAARAAGYAATGAWSILVAALLGLGAAAWGGAFGARSARRTAAGT